MNTIITFLHDNATWIIAFCALFTSLWSLHIQRRHNRLSVRPKLDCEVSHSNSFPHLWEVENRGAGPAVLIDFRMYVGKTELVFPDVDGMDAALNGAGLSCYIDCYSFSKGDYMRANTSCVLLSLPKEQAPLVAQKLEKVKWKFTYASIYGEQAILEVNGRS